MALRRPEVVRLRPLIPALLVLLAVPAAAGTGGAASGPRPLPGSIANGVLSWDEPAVGVLGTGGGLCSAVLVGCRTVLTAAHCICPGLRAEGCIDDPDLTDPERFVLFFQHAGFFPVRAVSVPEEFVFDVTHDVALLELAEPVTGIRPVGIGALPGGGAGIEVFFSGFGRGDGPADGRGLKRFGWAETVSCAAFDPPEATHVCIFHELPEGESGTDSSTCTGDSGGPLFAGARSDPMLVGVASGAGHLGCRAPNLSYFTELASVSAWLLEAGGSGLGPAACSDLPAVGEPGVAVLRGDGTADEPADETRFTLEVPPGVLELRVGLNGEAGEGNLDLYLRAGAPATPSAFDCAGRRGTPFEHCRVPAPAPGTWHVLVTRESGGPRFQLTTTLFSGEAPPPPDGAWSTSPELPGFRAKARITPAGREPVEAGVVEDCIPETLCFSGALAGRPEAFLKVIGPRPNGYRWVQISRFTPSRLELWVERIATGARRYYRLAPVGPGAAGLPGLQDRRAFPADPAN